MTRCWEGTLPKEASTQELDRDAIAEVERSVLAEINCGARSVVVDLGNAEALEPGAASYLLRLVRGCAKLGVDLRIVDVGGCLSRSGLPEALLGVLNIDGDRARIPTPPPFPGRARRLVHAIPRTGPWRGEGAVGQFRPMKIAWVAASPSPAPR